MATPEQQATEMIKDLIFAACPERRDEILEIWKTYSPAIGQQEDQTGFSMRGGPYGLINFTLRSMQQIWLLGFAGQAAFSAYCTPIVYALLYGKLDLDLLTTATNAAYDDLVQKVEELRDSERTTDVTWPATVPRPEDGRPHDVSNAMVFDVLCIAAAYCFLHELCHVKFWCEKNNTMTAQQEELKCDEFARSMLLAKVHEYAADTGYKEPVVNSKRAMSIGLGVFVILVLTGQSAQRGSESHPAVAERIEALAKSLSLHPNDWFWMYFGSLLIAHLRHSGLVIGTPRVLSIRDLCFELIRLLPSSP